MRAAEPIPHSPEAYAATYRRALADAETLVVDLAPRPFNWKPGADRWSVAECLDHLIIMGEAYVPVLEAAVAQREPRGGPPFRYGLLSRLFIHTMEPESTRKLSTGAAMMPGASAYDPDEVLTAFRSMTDGFVGVCERAEGLDLRRIKVTSPFMRLLRLPVGAFLEALAVHELRHLAQARRVTEAPDFPAG